MAPNKPNDGLAKLVRAEDAKKAMAEYHQAAAAVDANTLRLFGYYNSAAKKMLYDGLGLFNLHQSFR